MVQDLCVIMLTAGVTSIVFKLLRQPVVLGYIVAGLIVGPHMLGESWLSNEESVDTWGQIGVLFLLFALGLEFSFKKLLQVGGTALIAGGTIVVGMMGAGFVTGRLFGWNEMNALFLGGMLCMSSTTIVFKALDDMGLRNRPFARVCFGVLVVEDLFAVVLMVLLSSIATTRSFQGEQLLLQVGKLAAYLVFWFVTGIAVLPVLLSRLSRHLNDETLTIISVGLCLGMVLLAVEAGFSAALGAFVMGSVLAETLEAERIERLVEPVKNIFGSIFFVSVGMMIAPAQLVAHWPAIAVITLVVIVGQIVFASAGTLLSGQTLAVSLQTGFSLVQIGEFAFIIATLGQTLGVTSPDLYPIVVAVSVVTTFLTPFVMRGAGPACRFVNAHLSEGARLVLDNYARSRNTISNEATWKTLLRRVLVSLAINGIILAFADALYLRYAAPFLASILPAFLPLWVVHAVQLAILLALTSPLIYALATAHRHSPEAVTLWRSGHVQKAALIAIALLRFAVALAFVVYAVTRLFSITSAVVLAIVLIGALLVVFSRHVRRQSIAMQQQFAANLTARERRDEQHRAVSRRFAASLLDYDVHLGEFRVDPRSTYCGQALSELKIRECTGTSVVRIVRSGFNVNIPGGDARLYPDDLVIVAGSTQQLADFEHWLSASIRPSDPTANRAHVALHRFTVTADSPLSGVSILQSHIREQAHCIVMGIEHADGTHVMNPEPTLRFTPGDTVIVAGETERINAYARLSNADTPPTTEHV